LSPLLWCLVDELLTRLCGGGVYAQGYADDICLLEVGKFANTVTGLTQWALHTVEAWCSGHGLSINPDKTGLVAFTRKRKLPGFFDPRLFGRTLQCSTSVKYLGVFLDSRLTWSKYVDAKERKAHHLLWVCKRACGGAWGLEPRVVRWLYVSVIRPTVNFASLVSWPGCQSATVKKKLSSIQRLACFGITGAIRTTPAGAMESLLCLPPLELVVLNEARSAAHRHWSLGCWSYLHPNRGHSSVLMRLQQSDPIFSMRVDATRPTFNFEPKYRVTISQGRIGPRARVLLLKSKGSSGLRMGPRWRGPGLGSMGNR
jgi:hypothetical protein